MAPRNEHAPRAPAALYLADMPPEVIERILAGMSALRTLMAANATSRIFRGTPGGRSPVEHALRERVRARGHKRALPAALPPHVCSWTSELFARERVLQLACTHRHVVACSRAVAHDFFLTSAFVDAEGGLHTCGEWEDEGSMGQPTGQYLAHMALGQGVGGEFLVPTRVASLSAVRVVAVSAGSEHLLALSEAGAVYACCDDDLCNNLALGAQAQGPGRFVPVDALDAERVVCIAAGSVHSLALTAAGCVYSWGHNGRGQLGHGHTYSRRKPTRIEALDGVRVGGVAAGGARTFVLSVHGAVYSCGDGSKGRLGHGNSGDRPTPKRIEALAGVRAVHVSTGAVHSLVVDSEGGVHSFGSGAGGMLGHGDRMPREQPTRIEALAGVRAVSACAGIGCSAVLGAEGSLHTFGDNQDGQLCAPGTPDLLLPVRVQAFEPARVLDCALSDVHALYVTADGAAHACGMESAALGLGMSAGDVDGNYALVDDPERIGQLPRLRC